MDGNMFSLCNICGGSDLRPGDDGFFYCFACGSQSQQYQEQTFDLEDTNQYTKYAHKVRVATPPPEDAEGAKRKSLLDEDDILPVNAIFSSDMLAEDIAPWQPIIGPRTKKRKRVEDVFDPVQYLKSVESPIRETYLLGLQKMLEWQCEALVQKHGISPAICGIVAPIWLRFIASSRVLEKDWGKETIFRAAFIREENRRKRSKGGVVKKIKKKKRRKKEVVSDKNAAKKKKKKDKDSETDKDAKKRKKKDNNNSSNDNSETDTKKKKKGRTSKNDRGNNLDSEEGRLNNPVSENGEFDNSNSKKKKEKKNKNDGGNDSDSDKDTDKDSDDVSNSDDSEEIEDYMLETQWGFKNTLLVYLKKQIPLHVTLAIVLMACHLAQEQILATDIVDWALNGSIPYLNAFIRLETQETGFTWPIEARVMHKPATVTSAKTLEHFMVFIGKRIGLSLPPVNIKLLVNRYLKELQLPVDKITVYVCRLYDWYAPPELYFSDNPVDIPPRVCVMSMLIIVIKILYQLDGRWYWEVEQNAKRRQPRTNVMKIKKDAVQIPVDLQSEFCPKQLLEHLETLWDTRVLYFDYENDLRPYLDYCKEFVIPDFKMDRDGQTVCDQLWQLYEHPPEKIRGDSPYEIERLSTSEGKSLSGDSHMSFNDRSLHRETISTHKESEKSVSEAETPAGPDNVSLQENDKPTKRFRSLPELIHDIEELGFLCLPSRKKPYPRGIYVKYYWRPDGKLIGIHADFFILLCACAKVLKVHPMTLFWGVCSVENNLSRIEKKTDANTCEFN